MNSPLAQEIETAFNEATGQRYSSIPGHVIHRLAALTEGQPRLLHYLDTKVDDNKSMSGSAVIFTDSTVVEATWTGGAAARFESDDDEIVAVSVWGRRQLTSLLMSPTKENENNKWSSVYSPKIWPFKASIQLEYTLPSRTLTITANRYLGTKMSEFIESLHADLTKHSN